jgi:hypothetical protein
VFFENISSHSLWTELRQRMLPHERWFGVDWRHFALTANETSGSAAGTSAQATGSITPASHSAPKP